jgi:glycosyltransferase involved in cell wall biosynthesis
MNNPFLSVVIPVFNRPLDLARALDSLTNQSEKSFEVIVVDDGSTEDIKIITDKYINSLNLKLIRINNSGGPAKPRNVGIRASSSNWISLLDSDDWWYHTRISEVIDVIKNNPEFDIFYHKLKIINDGRIIKWWSTKSLGFNLSTNAFYDLMTLGNALPNSTVVIRKSCFEKFGFINELKDFISVEDFDYWLLLAKNKCKFYFINKCLGSYWMSTTGISANPDRTITRNRLILEKYVNDLDDCHRESAISKFEYFAGSVLYSNNCNSDAKYYLNRAKKLRGFVLNLKRSFKLFMINLKK